MTQPDPSSPTEICTDDACRDAVAHLYGYLDGQLDDDRRTVIQNHLDDCRPCLEAFDFHHELKALVSRNCQSELPEDLRRRVLAALEAFDTDAPLPRPSDG